MKRIVDPPMHTVVAAAGRRLKSPGELFYILLIGSMFFLGCHGGRPSAAKVDPDLAVQTLESMLQSWQQGQGMAEFTSGSPRVVVQDFQWTAGESLISYQLVSQQARDANLYVEVKLSTQAPGQSAKEEIVKYCVGTDPVLTVFRVLVD